MGEGEGSEGKGREGRERGGKGRGGEEKAEGRNGGACEKCEA